MCVCVWCGVLGVRERERKRGCVKEKERETKGLT